MERELSTIGVIGAGQIGVGIAQICCLAGVDVRILDRSVERAEAALAAITENLGRSVLKGTLPDSEARTALGRLAVASAYEELADCDAVIEAATENKETKRQIYEALCPTLKKDAIVGSTTSSFSITHLASMTCQPAQFIGMHFLYPVAAMELVEIVRGIATDDRTFDRSLAFIAGLGKTAIESADFPTFIVNRILLALINEATYALHERVGTIEAIDTSMRVGAHHPMGPLQLADFIGLDTCLSGIQALYQGPSDTKYRPCPLLVKYVDAGWLGRKTRRGFYDYRGPEPMPTR